MSSQQKSSLIEEFQKLDYFVGMCGDGANDCGALKMAHAGISLTDQEASVASPFTSKTPNIQCVPQLIKEGRGALVSSLCICKYIISNCILEYTSANLLLSRDIFYGQHQVIILSMVFLIPTYLALSLHHACPALAPYRPVRKLVSLPLLVSISANGLSSLVLVLCAFLLLQNQSWYSETDIFSACNPANQSMFSNEIQNGSRREATMSESFLTTTTWLILLMGYITISFVVSKGKPFRKPLYTNYLLSLILCAQTTIVLFFLFTNDESIQKDLQIVCTPITWRVSIFFMALVYFITTYTVEEYIADNRRFWIALKKFFKYESKSKYRILQRSLEKEPNWPPLDITIYAEPIKAELESTEGLLEISV